MVVRRYYSRGSGTLISVNGTPSVGLGLAGSSSYSYFVLFLLQTDGPSEKTMGTIASQNASRPGAVGRGKAEETSRLQPLCIEVPVTIRGVRLLPDSGKREPFSESTRTLIVFSHGAVLRLKAAVNPGQLIILTNEHTRKEIVCQVVKSTTCENVAGYIELQFTQPTLGFWGILFPGERSESQRAADASLAPSKPQPSAAEPHTTPPVGSPHRSSTGSINSGPLSQRDLAGERPATLASVSTPLAQSSAPPQVELIQPKLAPVSHIKENASAVEPLVFTDVGEAAISAQPAAEPREDVELAAFFSRLMFEAPERESAQPTSRRSSLLVLIAAEVLLGALAVGGWYWWRSRAHEAVGKLSAPAANVTAPKSVLPPANTLPAPMDSSQRVGTLNTAEASRASSVLPGQIAENHETPKEAGKMPPAVSRFHLSKPHAKQALSTAANAEASGIDSVPKVPSSPSVEGFSTLIGKPGLQPAPPTPARPVGGEVKAARLIWSAPPAYPSLARSQRVEGDVSLDALIDQNGRVTKIKVISGPELLREAAAAAVRQWKYEPASLDGKAVPMHLTVTVKFHVH
jgi:TonB family protein